MGEDGGVGGAMLALRAFVGYLAWPAVVRECLGGERAIGAVG